MDEYIKREDALKAIDRVRCEIHKPHEKYVIGELLMGVFDSAFDACDKGINRIPTADVAPKSEVDEIVIQWKEEANRWQNNYITELRDTEQIKAEVAREIFEEINSLRDEYSQGDIEYPDFQFRLGKIEKKYTEEK